MLLNGKFVADVGDADLLALIGNAYEKKDIDVKSALYPAYKDKQTEKESWRAEFCADLASFANSSGGLIICGMKEKAGQITELCGLGNTIDVEHEIQRLEMTANSGIEPRIPGLRFHQIKLSDAAKDRAVIIEIPRSYAGPHWVKETHRFHRRRSNGKFEMDLDELRAAFNLSEAYIDRIKEFRKERVNIINTVEHEDMPVNLSSDPKMLIHLVPLTFADSTKRIALNSFDFMGRKDFYDARLKQFARFNFDGIVLPGQFNNNSRECLEYFQIFRTGAIEFVIALEEIREIRFTEAIYLDSVEIRCVKAIRAALHMQRALGVEMPMTLMISLVGVKNYILYSERHKGQSLNQSKVKKEMLLLPEVVMNNYDEEVPRVLKPVFDVLWNTVGYDGSQNYDDAGDWWRD